MENGCLQAKNAGSLYPVGKIAEKAVWHCILSAELTKTHSFRFFGDFAHWVETKHSSYNYIDFTFIAV